MTLDEIFQYQMRFWIFSSLFNINSVKLHPNYSKYIDTHRIDNETEDNYVEDINDCDENNITSSCSVSVDDEDIKTPNIPLKIKSIFQMLCYSI